MGNVIEFPVKQAEPKGVFCEPLGYHFPTLFRVINTVSEQDLVDFGAWQDSELRPGTFCEYSLWLDAYIGEVHKEAVSHIRPEDKQSSLALRAFATKLEALSYFDGVNDMSLSDNKHGAHGGIYKTDNAFFTFQEIPTGNNWPGPCLFHFAHVPSHSFLGATKIWAHVVGPDGRVLDPSLFGY